MNISKKIISWLFLILFYQLTYSQIVEREYLYGSKVFSKSVVFYEKNQLKKSLEKLNESINYFPDNPSVDKATINKAYIEILDKNYQVADGVLIKFINDRKNSPFLPVAALYRAFIQFENKKYELSHKLFNEANKYSEKDISSRHDSIYSIYANTSLYWSGISLCLLGKFHEAEPFLVDCYYKYQKEKYADDALFALGQIAEFNRKYESAINYYNRINKDYPFSNSYVASRIHEANNRIVLRDPASALIILENADIVVRHIQMQDSIATKYESQSYVDNISEELLYLRGEAYNLAAKYDLAMINLKSFLETYHDSKLINYTRLGIGWAALNLKENSIAIKHYDDVIKDSKEESPRIKATAQLYRCIALKRLDNIEQAQKELTALALQSDYPYLSHALLELGQIYYETQEYDNARRTLERAEREASDALIVVRIHLLLGATNLELRRWNAAINDYKMAEQIALKGDSIFMIQKELYIAEARLKQGIALVKNFRNSEAINSLNTFLGDNKNDKRKDEALFWLAEAYYRTDMLKNASEKYQSLLKSFPQSPRREEALYGLGWSFFRLKDFQNSSSVFDKLIDEYPDSKFNLEVLSRQGDGYYVLKSYRKAADSYKKAAKLSPKSEEGQYCAFQLCQALYKLGAYEESISALMDFVNRYNRSSYSPYALYLIGWIRFQQKRYNEAIDNFTFLLQAYPQSELVPRANYAIGDAYYNMSNYDAAITTYKTLISSYPSSELAPEAMKSLQYCLMALGREDEAIQIADTFISANPSSPFAPEFKFKKAELFFNGKKFHDAISEYENFVKNYPDNEKNAQALYWMAKSYINLNEYGKADTMFTTIQKKFPKADYSPLSMLEQGLLAKQLNNIQKSDSIFKNLKKIYPDNQYAPQASYERAKIYFELQDTATALNLFREVAANYPETDFAYQSIYKIAMYHRLNYQFDLARAEFEKLVNITNNPLLAAEAQYRIGELWYRDKNIENAILAFKIVKDRFAGYEDWFTLSLLSLGEIFEANNDIEAASEVYQQIITLRPDDEYGTTAARRLKNLGNE